MKKAILEACGVPVALLGGSDGMDITKAAALIGLVSVDD